ncbi:MAG: hypothetical protein IT207_03040 [Fimbriimonadaceae bacterium]|nr:hypothetical protein [Fimbriimonadaceae bacterium]
MRTLLLGMLLASQGWGGTAPASPDIPILTEFDSTTFPVSWQGGEIRGAGVSLTPSEKDRSLRVLKAAFAKYPDGFLERDLKRVFVLRRISFYGLDYGGTNSLDTVYVTNDGTANGYTDGFLERAFHHELSSILLRNHMQDFDLTAWRAANPGGFQYGEGGTDALRTGKANTQLNEEAMAAGFVSQYSQASYEEDFNMVAESLFMGPKEFWAAVDRHAALAKKVRLAIAFYGKLDASFTETHFRALASS